MSDNSRPYTIPYTGSRSRGEDEGFAPASQPAPARDMNGSVKTSYTGATVAQAPEKPSNIGSGPSAMQFNTNHVPASEYYLGAPIWNNRPNFGHLGYYYPPYGAKFDPRHHAGQADPAIAARIAEADRIAEVLKKKNEEKKDKDSTLAKSTDGGDDEAGHAGTADADASADANVNLTELGNRYGVMVENYNQLKSISQRQTETIRCLDERIRILNETIQMQGRTIQALTSRSSYI